MKSIIELLFCQIDELTMIGRDEAPLRNGKVTFKILWLQEEGATDRSTTLSIENLASVPEGNSQTAVTVHCGRACLDRGTWLVSRVRLPFQ